MAFGQTYEQATLNYRKPDVAYGPPGHWSEGLTLGWKAGVEAYSPTMIYSGRKNHWQPIVEQLKEQGINLDNPAHLMHGGPSQASAGAAGTVEAYSDMGGAPQYTKEQRHQFYLDQVEKFNKVISDNPGLGIGLQNATLIDEEIFKTARDADLASEDFGKRATVKGKAVDLAGKLGPMLEI